MVKDVEGMVTIAVGVEPKPFAPYLTSAGALVPLRFEGGVLPAAWQTAIARAAATGKLTFPYSRLSPTWDPAALFRALSAINPFASIIYTLDRPYSVRGETAPVYNPRTEARAMGLPGFVDERGRLICLRIVRDAGRLVSGYSEPARVRAVRKDTVSAADVWEREAGAIAARAVALGGGILTRRNLAAATWGAVGFNEVTAFPPEVARACYILFGAKTVLDPCGGWGDRLAGALSLAPHLQLYVCTDPNRGVHVGYRAMIRELSPILHADPAKYVHMCAPFEDVPLRHEPGGAHLAINSTLFDLVFTSPPFFDLEIYCNDDSQSVARYAETTPTYTERAGGAKPPLNIRKFFALCEALRPKQAGEKRTRSDLETTADECGEVYPHGRDGSHPHGSRTYECGRAHVDALAPDKRAYIQDLLEATPSSRQQGLRQWFFKFLCVMLERAWVRLRSGGHMVISINDFAGTRYVRAMLAYVECLPSVHFRGVLGMDLTASVTYDGSVKAPLFVWQKV